MIEKQEILEIPNSVLMSAMYATLLEVKHEHLNPNKQTDFDPHYLIKMLKDVLLIDVDARLEAIEEEQQTHIAKAQARYTDEQDLNKHLQIITEMYLEKACKLHELASVRDKFYEYLNYLCYEASNTPEVIVSLDTHSCYDTIRFNRDEAIAQSPLCDPISIYNRTHANHLKTIKMLVSKSLEESEVKPE